MVSTLSGTERGSHFCRHLKTETVVGEVTALGLVGVAPLSHNHPCSLAHATRARECQDGEVKDGVCTLKASPSQGDPAPVLGKPAFSQGSVGHRWAWLPASVGVSLPPGAWFPAAVTRPCRCLADAPAPQAKLGCPAFLSSRKSGSDDLNRSAQFSPTTWKTPFTCRRNTVVTGRGAAFTHSPDTLPCLPAASSPTSGAPPCLEDRQAGGQAVQGTTNCPGRTPSPHLVKAGLIRSQQPKPAASTHGGPSAVISIAKHILSVHLRVTQRHRGLSRAAAGHGWSLWSLWFQGKPRRHSFCVVSKEHTEGIGATKELSLAKDSTPPPPPQVQPGLKMHKDHSSCIT